MCGQIDKISLLSQFSFIFLFLTLMTIYYSTLLFGDFIFMQWKLKCFMANTISAQYSTLLSNHSLVFLGLRYIFISYKLPSILSRDVEKYIIWLQSILYHSRYFIWRICQQVLSLLIKAHIFWIHLLIEASTLPNNNCPCNFSQKSVK